VPAFLAASPAIKLLGVDITSQIKNSLAGTLGISGNRLKSPKALIAERQAKADALKARVESGDRAAWEQLWLASGRALPIRAVMSAPINGNQGWPRVKPYLQGVLQELEAKYGSTGALPAQLPPTFQLPNLPGIPFADQLPAPVKDGVQKVADAVGTTSSVVGWIALGIGALLVFKALQHRGG